MRRPEYLSVSAREVVRTGLLALALITYSTNPSFASHPSFENKSSITLPQEKPLTSEEVLEVVKSEYFPMANSANQVIDRPFIVSSEGGLLYSEYRVAQVWNDLMSAHVAFSLSGQEVIHLYPTSFNHMGFIDANSSYLHLAIVSEATGIKEESTFSNTPSTYEGSEPLPQQSPEYRSNPVEIKGNFTGVSELETALFLNEVDLPQIPPLGIFTINLRPGNRIVENIFDNNPTNFWFFHPKAQFIADTLFVSSMVTDKNGSGSVIGLWEFNPNNLQPLNEPKIVRTPFREYDLLSYQEKVLLAGTSISNQDLLVKVDSSESLSIFTVNQDWGLVHPQFVIDKEGKLRFASELHSASGKIKTQVVVGTYNMASRQLEHYGVISGGPYRLETPTITTDDSGNYLIAANSWYSGYAIETIVARLDPATDEFNYILLRNPRGYGRISGPFTQNGKTFIKAVGSALDHNWQGIEETTILLRPDNLTPPPLATTPTVTLIPEATQTPIPTLEPPKKTYLPQIMKENGQTPAESEGNFSL